MSKSLVQFWKVIYKTDPPKLDDLSLEEIKRYERYLSAKLPTLEDELVAIVCRNRIELLRQEIQFRRKEKKDDQWHQKTLLWERVGVGIGIGAILVAVVGLVYEIFFSKAQRANTEPASPQTYFQRPMPTTGLKPL